MNPDRTHSRDARHMARQIAQAERHAANAARKVNRERVKAARRAAPALTPDEHSALIQAEYIRTRHPDVWGALERETAALLEQMETYSEGEDYTELSGFGSKLKKAVKKVTKVAKKTLNPIEQVKMVGKAHSKVLKKVTPKPVLAKAKKFEQGHRKEIKIAGAVTAVALGAYALAPAAVGGALSSGFTSGKALAIGLAKKLGGSAATDVTWEKVKDKASDAATEKMADMVKRVGQDKFNEIVAKYTGDGEAPPTSPDDPRFQDMQAELVAAAEKISPTVAQASVIQESKSSGETLKKALPYVGAGAALLSLLS